MTTQATHTPGPWQHVKHGGYEFLWANGGKFPMGVTFQQVAGMPADMQDANARLIAAAPDLLAALETIAAGNTDADGMVRIAAEALSKAEGRAGQ